jgi:hypothetical protein
VVDGNNDWRMRRGAGADVGGQFGLWVRVLAQMRI